MTTTTSKPPYVVGLSGYARSGKDTVAKILRDDHGYTPIAYADLLRSCVEALNPIVGVDDFTNPKPKAIRYLDAKEAWGYEGAKESPYGDEFRGVLQRMGTDVGRNLLGGNIWVEATMNSLETGQRYVVTDCRFPNEAQAVLNKNGFMIRIKRPGFGPANDHLSETALDRWPFDLIIDNISTVAELAHVVDGYVRWMENKYKVFAR